GLKYSDIAVLCANPSQYKSCVKTSFDRYGIPFFADIPEPILHHPLVNLITALLNVLCEFTVDNVLSYIKTGFLQKKREKQGDFAALTTKDINVFESYLYEWAVSSEALKKPFVIPEELDENSKRAAEKAEEIRAIVVPPVLHLRKQLDGKNGNEITELIFDFLRENIGIERAINYRIKSDSVDEKGNALNDSALVRSYQRLWDTLADVFDKLYTGLENDYIKLSDYAQMFRDICSAATLAKPPQYIDTVLVGDIDRTRTGDVKAVFILGALEDAFPSTASAEGVFSAFETEIIRESITHITANSKKEYCLKSAREQYCLSLYRAYRAVSKPTDYLCLSYHDITPSGAEGRPSEVVTNILSLMGRQCPQKAWELPEDFWCRSERAAKQRFAAGVRTNTAQHSSVRAALCSIGREDYAQKLEELRDRRTAGIQQHIAKEAAELLFPTRISATKIEKLNLCKFQFFCEIGLGITEPTVRSFNRIQRGNVVHYCMEKILRRYSARMGEFFSLSRRQLTKLVKRELDTYKSAELSAEFAQDKRNCFLFDNIVTITTDMLVMTQAEFYARQYRPKFFELKLSDTDVKHIIPADESSAELPKPPCAELSESDGAEDIADAQSNENESGRELKVKPLEFEAGGRKITVTGLIDRVDMFTDEKGQQYLRVV
ncbi:MAG: PD-(D/E)XK nuclease family protein, partial [Oscillospiraceae bacterium]